MKVPPFTWKVTGWFMIGWSAEYAVGDVRPLRYFGEDLVIYRDSTGELHVLEGHCKHLGAHIGHGGTVVGDCVECPFHGWRWGTRRCEHLHSLPTGPAQQGSAPADLPGSRAARLHLPVAPSGRRAAAVGASRHVHQVPPQFTAAPPTSTTGRTRSSPASPRTSRCIRRSWPKNGPDSAHFHYVHKATVTPVCLEWEAVDEEWRFLTGWPDARSDDPNKMALRIHSHFSGLGFAISAFEGSSNHRLIFACTPVDDEVSNMFYSIWWPRKKAGDTSDIPPDDVRERVEKQYLGTVWDDLEIWRYQKYVEHPALAKVDAKPYMAMRKWALQFYDVSTAAPV